MARMKMSAAAVILATLQTERDLTDVAVTPVREKRTALATMKGEIETLQASEEDFKAKGNPDDEVALQRSQNHAAKARVLTGRVAAAEAALGTLVGPVAERLEDLQRALLAAHFAHRDAQLQRVTEAFAPFFIQPGHAERAAAQTDFILAYAARGRDLRLTGTSDVIGAAIAGIEAADALLSGRDLCGDETFAPQRVAAQSQVDLLKARQAEAEANVAEENAARAARLAKETGATAIK